MTDPKNVEPDEELLEFLGGIDEVNDEARGEDFSEFLAATDIDKIAGKKPAPTPPVKGGAHE